MAGFIIRVDDDEKYAGKTYLHEGGTYPCVTGMGLPPKVYKTKSRAELAKAALCKKCWNDFEVQEYAPT